MFFSRLLEHLLKNRPACAAFGQTGHRADIAQIEIPHRNSLSMRRPTEIVLVNAMPTATSCNSFRTTKTRWGH
jgi:hypothetical protein